MKLQITSGKIPLSGTVEDLIAKNLGTDIEKYVENFDDGDLVANIRVQKRSRYGYKVIYEMRLPGNTIYSEEEDEDLRKAVRKLKYEVIRQIKRHKDKLSGNY